MHPHTHTQFEETIDDSEFKGYWETIQTYIYTHTHTHTQFEETSS